jgi:predicted dinucleotide-binding enzyme
MRLAILGAGNVGGALGRGWARSGHTIAFGVRNPDDPKHAAAANGAGGAVMRSIPAAVQSADAIVLAVSWDGVPAAVAACGDLAGRIVIDVTNPLRFTGGGLELATGFDTSGGEKVAALARGARVVKTLNQVGFAVMDNTSGYANPPVMFVASDDADAKTTAIGLVRDLGFEALDGGALKTARLLEPLAMLWIDQVMRRGAPPNCAFALLNKR